MEEFSADALRRGRINVYQPEHGYRFSADPLLLSAFVRPKDHACVLDVGAGCGIIPLILGLRHKTIRILGVEIQPELTEAARLNIIKNRLEDRVRILNRDFLSIVPDDIGGRPDIIVSNPPFKKKGSGRLNPDPRKAVARHEITLTMRRLLTRSASLLNPLGRLCVIYPARRTSELICGMGACGFAPSRIQFIHSGAGKPAGRVMVSGIRLGNNDCRVLPPIYTGRSGPRVDNTGGG